MPLPDWNKQKSSGAGGSQSASRFETQSSFQNWPNYLKDGYFESDGALRPEFVSRAKIEPLIEQMVNAKLTMSQARRFFQHCRAIERRLRSKQSSWNIERSNFKRLDYFAANALNKPTGKIPQLFGDFIQRNVDTVKTEKDFLDGFLTHFEALLGFFPSTSRR